MIVIDKFSNLTVWVHAPKQENRVPQDEDGEDSQDEEVDPDSDTRGREVEEFKVCRSTLMDHSSHFRNMLSPGRFAEGEKTVVTLEDDHITSMEILFRVIHDISLESTLKTSVRDVWFLLAAIDKYDVDMSKFKVWFETWYKSKKLDLSDTSIAASILYPCYAFSHAPAFGAATRALTYRAVGHIVEKNPSPHRELHLPSRVIQQINAAKGRLRTILHLDLFKPNASLLEATCNCKEKTLFGYEKALYLLKVWPLEQMAHKNSIDVILSRLEKFTYQAPDSACGTCRKNYDSVVATARERVARYFDGLCLDCMDRSKPKTGDRDDDYWRHNELDETEFIRDRKFVHKQPSWYFSFMGRREDRERFRGPKKGT